MRTRGVSSCRSSRRGFTLIEVLVTLVFMAIVLPAIMQGFSVAMAAASAASRRSAAGGLAESKLDEIVSTAQWQNNPNLSGDFGPDWQGYTWQLTVNGWAQDTTNASLQQLDLRVNWMARGHQEFLVLSTLTFTPQTQQQ